MKIKVGKHKVNKIKEKLEIDFPVYVSIDYNNGFKDYYKLIDLYNRIKISTYNDNKCDELKYCCKIDVDLDESCESKLIGLSNEEILIKSLILESDNFNILTAPEFNKHYKNYKKGLEKWL